MVVHLDFLRHILFHGCTFRCVRHAEFIGFRKDDMVPLRCSEFPYYLMLPAKVFFFAEFSYLVGKIGITGKDRAEHKYE